MPTYRPPALDKAAPIVNPADGRITPYFQRFWQNLAFTTGDASQDLAGITAFGWSLIEAGNAAAGRSVLGLQNVDNTADAAKPVSMAMQAALDAKAPLASPALTGTPTAPTAAAGADSPQIATTAFVRGELAALTGSAPAGLDTLGELAAALDEDPAFAATVAAGLAGKVDKAASAGWTAASGAASQAGFATFAAPAIANPPTQAEVQAIADHLQALSQHLKAVIDALLAAELIDT